jgi:hypothetical protein
MNAAAMLRSLLLGCCGVSILACSGIPKGPDLGPKDITKATKCDGMAGGGAEETLAHMAWGYMKSTCTSLPQELDVFTACKETAAALVGTGAVCPATSPTAGGSEVKCMVGFATSSTLDADASLGIGDKLAIRASLKFAGYDALAVGVAVKPISQLTHLHQGSQGEVACGECILTYTGSATYQLFAYSKATIDSSLKAGTSDWLVAVRAKVSNALAWGQEGPTFVCGFEEDGLKCGSPATTQPGTNVPTEPIEVQPPKPVWVAAENPSSPDHQ